MTLSTNEVKATMLAVLATVKRWRSDFKGEKEDITDINTIFLLQEKVEATLIIAGSKLLPVKNTGL